MSTTTLSEGYMNLAEKFEGNHAQAYPDSGGLWTIGIGHLIRPNEIQKYLGMSIEEANRLYFSKDNANVNHCFFYSKAPKLTQKEVHDLKNSDMKAAVNAVAARIKSWNLQLAEVPQRHFEVLVDLAFNGGAGQLDQSIAGFMRKRQFDEAVMFTAKFVNSHSRKYGKAVPTCGLTLRRYSMIWYAFSGEAWRIGGNEATRWAEVDQFLKKLTNWLKTKGKVNPLPYACNRRENQLL